MNHCYRFWNPSDWNLDIQIIPLELGPSMRKQTSASDLAKRRDSLFLIILEFGDLGCTVKQLINHTRHLALYPLKDFSRRDAIYSDLRSLRNEELIERSGNSPHARNSVQDYIWRVKKND